MKKGFKPLVMENWFFLPSLCIVAVAALSGVLFVPILFIYFFNVYYFIILPRKRNDSDDDGVGG